MDANKNLLVICAMGYATSTMIKKGITDYFDEHGIRNWNVDSTSLGMVCDYHEKIDLIVTSLGLGADEYDVPIINGVPLISGIGKDDTLREIAENIHKIENAES